MMSIMALPSCMPAGHGTVTEVHDMTEATVKLGVIGQVAPGDRVAVLETTCKERVAPTSMAPGSLNCDTQTVGHGVVVSLPDSETAVVRTDPGTLIEVGMFVRKEREQAH